MKSLKMNILNLKNFKISIYLQYPIFPKEKTNSRLIRKIRISNNTITLTVYHHSPHILHATGLKNVTNLDDVSSILKKSFFCKIKQIQIDSFFFTTKLNNKIDLEATLKTFKSYKQYFVSYEPEIFPALICKPRISKHYPSAFFFQTGSVIILAGSQSIRKLALFIKHILEAVKVKKDVR